MAAMLPLLVGCFPATEAPDCFLRAEAEHVALTYEEFADEPLTQQDFDCIHDFKVIRADQALADDLCRRNGSIACYITHGLSKRDRTMVFSMPVWDRISDEIRVAIARHEITHHLLRCLEGNPDPSHQSAAFDASGQAMGGPSSLIRYSFSLEASAEAEWGHAVPTWNDRRVVDETTVASIESALQSERIAAAASVGVSEPMDHAHDDDSFDEGCTL